MQCFYDIHDVVVCFGRRVLCYPLHRHFDLVTRALNDTVMILQLGKHSATLFVCLFKKNNNPHRQNKTKTKKQQKYFLIVWPVSPELDRQPHSWTSAGFVKRRPGSEGNKISVLARKEPVKQLINQAADNACSWGEIQLHYSHQKIHTSVMNISSSEKALIRASILINQCSPTVICKALGKRSSEKITVIINMMLNSKVFFFMLYFSVFKDFFSVNK